MEGEELEILEEDEFDLSYGGCEFCGTQEDDHEIGCPNDNSSFGLLFSRGFD